MVIFIGAGLVGHLNDGFSKRFSNDANFQALQEKLIGNYGLSASCEQNFIEGGECATSENPDILVWGDSYAMHLVPGIVSSNERVKLQQATVSQCAPILGYAIATAIHGALDCIAFNEDVYKYLSKSDVKYVVLASPFSTFHDNRSMVDATGRLYSNGAEITFSGLVRLVKKIREMGKIPVIFTPPPADGRDLGECLMRQELDGQSLSNCDFQREHIIASKRLSSSKIEQISAAQVVNLTDFICSSDICRTSLEGYYLYRDTGHLSYEGSRILGTSYDFFGLITNAR